MLRLTLVVVPLLALAGCKTENTAFCAMNPGMQDCPGDAANGGTCKGSSDCRDTPEFPVCDTTDNTCVQCTAGDQTHCMGTTPRCEDRACVACVDDSDCDAGAGVCLPSGGCADPSSIIHAVPTNGSTASDCGAVSKACTLDTALSLVNSPAKNVIKLDDTAPYISAMNNFIVDADAAIGLTIEARGAVLHRNSDGPILTINSNKGVTILGGTIEGATGGGGDGIRCNASATLAIYGTTIRMNDGLGINGPGCALTLSRSQIVSNRGGGVIVSNNKFAIVGNMFLGNGDLNSPNPGVTIFLTTADSANRLEFNTIANNATMIGALTGGVDCKAGTGFAASHNIIWSNTVGGSTSIPPQIANTCLHSYSDIGPLMAVGTGNINDPPLLSPDGHLGPGSPAIKKAEIGADLSGLASRDIDGDLRVAPADIGADQVPRP